jgi:hypothetical protein
MAVFSTTENSSTPEELSQAAKDQFMAELGATKLGDTSAVFTGVEKSTLEEDDNFAVKESGGSIKEVSYSNLKNELTEDIVTPAVVVKANSVTPVFTGEITAGDSTLDGDVLKNTSVDFVKLSQDAIDGIVAEVSNPSGYIPQGNIAVAADFPTVAEVLVGWQYQTTAAVTDNDPAKTNTGQVFLTGTTIVWKSGGGWMDLGVLYVTQAQKDKIDLGANFVKHIDLTTAAITPFEGAVVTPDEDGIYGNYGGLEKNNEVCNFVYESSEWVKKTFDIHKNIIQEKYSLVEASDDFAYKTTQQWTPAGSGSETLEWLLNSSEFTYGDYYFKLTKDATTSFQELKIDIPEDLRAVGKKLKVRFINKADNDQKYTVYQYGASGYLGTSTDVVVTASATEQYTDIDFVAASGLTNIRLAVRSYGGTGNVIKIGSTKLLAHDDKQVFENTEFATSIFKIIDDRAEVTWNTVTVNAGGGGDYFSLRSAIEFVNTQPMSATNRWKITVANGVYPEIDIAGADNAGADYPVIVEGESREGVIIRTDGLSTSLSPANYNIGGGVYDEVPINTIPQIYKHAFWIHEYIQFYNMTVWSNDVKYCVHQDQDTGDYDSLFNNCYFIHQEDIEVDFGNVIGIGSHFGQYQRYHSCVMELRQPNILGNGMAVGWHNWNNEAGPTGMEMIKCDAINCNIIRVEELGSDHMDIVKVYDCRTNLRDAGMLLTLAQGYYTPTPPTPEDYPYNIQMDIHNTPMNYCDFQTGTRENAGVKFASLGDYHIKVKNVDTALIARGTAVKRDYSPGNPVYETCVVKATDNDYDFILWEDINNGDTGFAVPKGKTVKFLSVGGTWVRGDWVKINTNGLAVITTTLSERIGICAYDGLSGIGYLRTYLLP